MSWGEKTDNKENVADVIEFKSIADVNEDRGLNILCYGEFSSGKTHFSLSATGPVYVIDTENGSAPLANKFPNAKVLNINSKNLNGIEEEQAEVENWMNWEKVVDYIVGLPKGTVGTVVVDSTTDIWAWAQAYAKIKRFKLSIDDRLKQQFDWSIINAMFNRSIMKLINADFNVIFTARANEIYSGPGQPTGQYQPATQKKLPYFADVVLYHTNRFVNGKFEFSARITKMRQMGELTGKVLVNPTFDMLKEMMKNEK